MKITIENPSDEMLKKLNVFNWPVWTKEVAKFDWRYDEKEMCYILEGKVTVETEEGEKIEIKAGDFVTFPKGLSCIWEIKESIRKHYNFG